MNVSYMNDYVLLTLTILLSTDENWEEPEKVLLEAANTECGDYIRLARKHLDSLCNKLNVGHESGEPKVALELPEPNLVHLILRFPAPFSERRVREQSIYRKLFNKFGV